MAIRMKRTTTTGYTWQAGDTVEGQLGLNLTDGTLHFKKSNGDYVALSSGSSGITDLVQDTTPQLGGQLDVQTYKITTSVSNGSIELNPNGTGDVLLTTDTVQIGDPNATATITTNGTGNLVLNTNSGTSSGSITIAQGANSNITINPNGTGDVLLTADTVFIGDSSTTGTLQSAGSLTVKATSGDGAGLDSAISLQAGVLSTSDPIVTTTGGTLILGTTGGFGFIAGGGASGSLQLRGYADGLGTVAGGEIVIPATANSNITINPQGTGDVYLQADTVRVGDSAAAATITTFGAGTLTLNTNAGTNSGSIVINQGANTNITLTPNGTGDVQLVADTVQIGDANAAATLTTNGTGNLVLNTNSNTNSGNIIINQGTNANIEITPNGTGKINLDGAVWPNALGTAGQVLTTDASGVLSWTTASGGATNTIILYTAGITIPNSSNGVDTGFWNILDSGGVSGVSVNQGSITLPAGTYQISIPTLYKVSADTSDHKIRCTTDSIDIFTFSNATSMTIAGSSYLGIREFNGRFIFASSKTIAFTNATSNTSQVRLNTLPTSSTAANSTYSQISQALTIRIQKLA